MIAEIIFRLNIFILMTLNGFSYIINPTRQFISIQRKLNGKKTGIKIYACILFSFQLQ